jgi:hypothetical protein
VTGHDTGLLVVTGGVTGELEDLGGEVWSKSARHEEVQGGMELSLTLKDGSEVDGGTGTDTLGVVAPLQETVDTADGDCSKSARVRTATW